MSESTLEDTILIDRAKKGDRSALDSLIAKHSERAYKYAFRLTHNQDDSADIVAEAFVRVYGAIGNFKGQSSFGTWLYRILTNCFLDQKKHDKSRTTESLDGTVRTEEGNVTRQFESNEPSPSDRAERNNREEVIENAVNRLPDYQKAMIVMFHAEMLSYDEIAAALDLPIGTVKSRLNRARQQLGEILAKNQELFNYI